MARIIMNMPYGRYYKSIAILSAVSVIIIVYLMINTHREVNEATKKQYNTQQMLIARQIGLSVEHDMRMVIREMENISKQQPVMEMDIEKSLPLLQGAFNHVKTYSVNDIALMNANGIVVLPLVAKHLAGSDFSYRNYYQKARRFNKRLPVYEHVEFMGVDAEQRGIVIAMPVFAESGEFNGLVLLSMKVNEFLGKQLMYQTSENKLWAIDSEGKVLYHRDYPVGENVLAQEGIHESFRAFIETLVSGRQHVAEYVSPDGTETIAASYPIEVAGQTWSVAVSSPTSVFEVVSRFSGHYALGMVLIALVGVGAIAMVVSYNAELRKAHASLERRIKERTAELDEALRQVTDERAKSEAIIAAIGDGISIQDKDLRVLYQNAVHKDMFGEHIGEHCYSAFFSQDKRCKDCLLVGSLNDDRVHTGEKILTTSEKAKCLEVTTSPLKDSDGNIIAGIEVVRNITQRKMQEEELKNISTLESIGRLSVGIAHEINNPLTNALLKIQMLRDELGEKLCAVDSLKSFDSIERHIYAASNIAKELLQFAHPKATEFMPVDINSIIRSALLLLKFKLKDIKVHKSLEELPDINGDPIKLEQVFVNLINNSIEAMPQGGSISISSTLQHNRIRVTLTDTGHGISRDDIDKVFEPFYTTKEFKRGTGLGLSICYGIIKQHEGSIEVLSSEKGTTILIEIPLRMETEK